MSSADLLTCRQLALGPPPGARAFGAGGESGACAAGSGDGEGDWGHWRRVQLCVQDGSESKQKERVL